MATNFLKVLSWIAVGVAMVVSMAWLTSANAQHPLEYHSWRFRPYGSYSLQTDPNLELFFDAASVTNSINSRVSNWTSTFGKMAGFTVSNTFANNANCPKFSNTAGFFGHYPTLFFNTVGFLTNSLTPAYIPQPFTLVIVCQQSQTNLEAAPFCSVSNNPEGDFPIFYNNDGGGTGSNIEFYASSAGAAVPHGGAKPTLNPECYVMVFSNSVSTFSINGSSSTNWGFAVSGGHTNGIGAVAIGAEYDNPSTPNQHQFNGWIAMIAVLDGNQSANISGSIYPWLTNHLGQQFAYP